MINFETYRRLYSEAKEYSDIDMYIAERGWQDWMNDMDTDDIADILRNVYNISREGIKGILTAAGCKLSVLCRNYCIPYTTAQKWALGEREAPEYTLMLLGFAVLSDINAKPAED